MSVFPYGNRVISAITVLFFCAAVILPAGDLPAQGAYTTRQASRAADDAELTDDLDKKLDKTIKVLQVIKRELKDLDLGEEPAAKAAPQSAAAAPEDESAWADNLRRLISKLRKILSAVRKVAAEVEDEPRAKSSTPAEQEALKKDLSDNLDKTIKAMQVIKEELDKDLD